jgi:hypothetical protein
MCNPGTEAKNDEVNRNAEGKMPRGVGPSLDKVPLLRRGDRAPTLLTVSRNTTYKMYNNYYF